MKHIYLLLLFFLTTNCGFQPLYLQTKGAAHEELAGTEVSVIADREGQILRNLLTEKISVVKRTTEKDKRYALDVNLSISEVSYAIRLDGTASRKRVSMVAQYVLKDKIHNNKVLTNGKQTCMNTYRIEDAPFAMKSSDRDAKFRCIVDLHHQILNDLMIYFNGLSAEASMNNR